MRRRFKRTLRTALNMSVQRRPHGVETKGKSISLPTFELFRFRTAFTGIFGQQQSIRLCSLSRSGHY